MSEINFVTRENGMSELISKSYNEEFLELEEILNNHYPYILKSINNENYHIELGISDFFEEILLIFGGHLFFFLSRTRKNTIFVYFTTTMDNCFQSLPILFW